MRYLNPPLRETSAAFFDVDETLINVKSMFSFLEFYLRKLGEPEATYGRLSAELRHSAGLGVPRKDINRHYYRFYAGHSAQQLARAGREWFTAEQEKGSLFIPETRTRLQRHLQQGEFVVLLSGSFFACLEPVTEHLGAHWAIGTRPVIRRGRLTGEVLTPMIGSAKGRAARATAAVRGVDLAQCSAYGDHSSDLDLLASVGRPVVVGDDAVLADHAARAGWQRIFPGRGPAPAMAPPEVTAVR
jgi:HAD superfamily hydrolase (TIGR01490 family)